MIYLYQMQQRGNGENPHAKTSRLAVAELNGENVDAQAEGLEKEEYELYQFYRDLGELVDQVERNYAGKIDRKELYDAAMQGILDKLGPHCQFIPKKDASTFMEGVDSQFGGIGVVVQQKADGIFAAGFVRQSPGQKAGVKEGDKLLAADGKSFERMGLTEVVKLLKGPANSELKLSVLRRGEKKPTEIKVTRKVIPIESVLGVKRDKKGDWDFLFDAEKKIGYILVETFSKPTAADLKKALIALEKQGVERLILDLRSNPGGLLSSALEVADMFVEKGTLLVNRGRNTRMQKHEATAPGTFKKFKLVVLIDNYSASGAEIVAAALQDLGRATIVGKRSYGKGSIQDTVELPNGNMFKITTAYFYRPNGKRIDRDLDAKTGEPTNENWGVSPKKANDVSLEWEEMKRFLRYREEAKIARQKSGSWATDPLLPDAQMERAIKVLTEK